MRMQWHAHKVGGAGDGEVLAHACNNHKHAKGQVARVGEDVQWRQACDKTQSPLMCMYVELADTKV